MNQMIRRLLDDKQDNHVFHFFWQHGKDHTILRKYMQVIHYANIGAVCVESRPHPDFCGPRWWADMDVILHEARKRGMKVWIFDDSHFPTGFANGAMMAQPDERCRRSLTCKTIECGGKSHICLTRGELAHPEPPKKSLLELKIEQIGGPSPRARLFDDDRLLDITAVRQDGGKVERLNLTGFVRKGILEWDVPAGDWNVYILYVTGNAGYHPDYINMMDAVSWVRDNYRPFNYEVGDFDIHVDDETGKGHLFETGSRNGAFSVYGMELSEDFCSAEKFISAQYKNVLPPFTREGVTLFEYKNKKYLVTSGMTGYIPNPSDAVVSDSWETPFISIGNPHINDMSKASFNSQISQIFKLHGSGQIIAVADRYMPEGAPDGELSEKLQSLIASTNNSDETELTDVQREKITALQAKDLENCNTSISDYVWLPVTIKDGKVCVAWVDEWKPEVDS
jgi:hypothetical protein